MIETIAVVALVVLLGAIVKGINLGQPSGEGFAPGWVVRYPKCNFTVDARKAGLIRHMARGTSRKYGWC